MDSEDESGRTLVQVISEKYSPDNFPYCRGPGVGVVIRTSPQGSPVKDRLNLPSVLVLDGCGITHAGDEEEVATFCSHVVELDLSHNQFSDWGEISKILSNIPHLDFLNLSMNPLKESCLDTLAAEAFSGLRRLVLNNTHVSWDMVHTLTQEIPELEELFLCLNEYERVSLSPVACSSLRLLHITDNQLQHWGEVRKLGLMYPGLASLILANNSLSSIHEPEDSLQRLFPNLNSINLHNSGLNSWEDIEKLNSFPKLQEVRLMGIPLLQPYTDQERRYLMVAHLPSVTVLNGSVVTDGEREDAERFYIRYHLDCPEDELPQSALPILHRRLVFSLNVLPILHRRLTFNSNSTVFCSTVQLCISVQFCISIITIKLNRIALNYEMKSIITTNLLNMCYWKCRMVSLDRISLLVLSNK
ncbi:tubulin-specific chaperone cofactor E-like protein isoform X2 [Salminus brasiliensis]|uniref:tubulin-specific chaperone cofactor E-like protein isoform X2 n=1 Tax=Salminus brasiliensis TaxID=930266 RepID=UPI003B8362DB